METIKIEPTSGGYSNIGRQFVQSLASDFKTSRRESALVILGELLSIVGMLASKGEYDLVQRIIDEARTT